VKIPNSEPEKVEIDTIRREHGDWQFSPLVFRRYYFMKLSDLNEFMKASNYLKDIDQKKLVKEIYGMPFIKHYDMHYEAIWIDGIKQGRSGVWLRIDFGHDIFKEFFGMSGKFVFSKKGFQQEETKDEVKEGEIVSPDDVEKQWQKRQF
jgi:hypothetical protein